jgi:hypothetical protein
MKQLAVNEKSPTGSLTFVIRIDGFSSTRQRQSCRVTFFDAETSKAFATRSFDSRFVRQASVLQLMNVMGVGYRYRSHRVEEATRRLRLTMRRVSRAVAESAGRGHPTRI